VLEPLAEIAPDWVDPVTGRTIRELMSRLLP
jgi:7,8-dihydro-6-hydroxymethylpterin-pyrophosphokinase